MKEKQPEKQKRGYGSLVQLMGRLMRYKGRMALVLLLVAAGNLVALVVPRITGDMVDSLDLAGKIDFDSLLRDGLLLILAAVVVWGLSAAQNRLMLSVAQSMVVDLRHDVFQRLLRLPVSYFDGNTKGNIISILSTDVDNISDTVSADLITLVTGFVTVAGALIMMLAISPWLTLIFAVTIPMMVVISRYISKNARRLFREKKASYGRLCG